MQTNDENSFDPTPRLKSSPIPIEFISFNRHDKNCIYCGEKYIETYFCYQKYCKKCLSSFINNINDNNIYLDVVYIYAMECSEYRTKVPQNIQEFCENYVILHFKQIYCYDINDNGPVKNRHVTIHKVIESEKNCKLCGKSLYQGTDRWTIKAFRLCSDCYLISFGSIESTLIKKQISILYLPWWYSESNCDVCSSKLTFTSDFQKYCVSCYIFYVGCRYCLTTNIIFGPIIQSQCKKCKRMSVIINSNTKSDIDDFLLCNFIFDNLDKLKIQIKFANFVKYRWEYFYPWNVLISIIEKNKNHIKSISYSQFTDVKEIAKGGYGNIYKANWLSENKTVILKRFKISKYFLNELKSCQHFSEDHSNIIETYGFTKDPELEDYILVMKYASEGDLHKYLQKNFTNITWNKQKLYILYLISAGLETIHNKNFMHRDFHSGNILFDSYHGRDNWKIGDLGLSQAVNTESSNNEIYGVIPYIAPEIFKGSNFTKEADIYSFGMIMWELTTGCKPFDNVKHDIHLVYEILDGERPKITEDTPECYANLMKRCWDPDPEKRPPIIDINLAFDRWIFNSVNEAEYIKAEEKRKKLIKSKKIGPEFAEKRHSEAIYTSRPLSALISECTSINSISFADSNYISELENNTNTKSLSPQNLNFTIPNFSPVLDSNYISIELELDIDTGSPMIQNFSTSLKKRRNEVFLNVETHENSGKRVKTSLNYILNYES